MEDKDRVQPPGGAKNDTTEGHAGNDDFLDAAYAFPNDDLVQSAEDERHAMYVMLCEDRLHLAPVFAALSKPGAKVLDLGTGTGLWALDMSVEFPLAQIVGVDLSPMQPELVPKNVKFLVGDIEHDIGGDDNSYDFVFCRHTVEYVVNVPQLLAQIYRLLKPGGYVEFHGNNHSPHCDDDTLTASTRYAVREWMQLITEGLWQYSRTNFSAMTTIEPMVREAGFESVAHEIRKLPMGLWPSDPRFRRIGFHALSSWLRALRTLSVRPFGPQGLNWSPTEVEVFLALVRKDAMNPGFHTYFPHHTVYARKPF